MNSPTPKREQSKGQSSRSAGLLLDASLGVQPEFNWQLVNIPVSGKRNLREKKSFFRESFATPSPRPFVCSVRSGAIVAAAIVLANTVVAVHLRAVRSVKCRQSPSFALATCGCRRCAEPCNKLPGLSPVFRGSFAKLAPK